MLYCKKLIHLKKYLILSLFTRLYVTHGGPLNHVINLCRRRYFVIYKVPTLQFLDSRRITHQERSEALKRGEFTRVRRPEAAPPVSVAPTTAGTLRPLPVDLAALGKHKGEILVDFHARNANRIFRLAFCVLSFRGARAS